MTHRLGGSEVDEDVATESMKALNSLTRYTVYVYI